MRFFAVRESRALKALWPLLRLYPWAIPALIVLGVASSLAEGIGISLFIPFLQGLDNRTYDATGNWLVDTLGRLFNGVEPSRRIAVISACILAAVLLTATLAYAHRVLFNWLDARISHRLRSGIFRQLLSVGYGYLERHSSGRLLNTLATETWRTGQAISVVVDIIITLCTLAVYVTLLLLISWKLTLLVALAMLGISAVVQLFTRRVEDLGRQATTANSTLAMRMLEGFGGMKIIRAFAREEYEQGRFDRDSERVGRAFFRLGVVSGAVSPIYEVLSALLLVGILFTTVRGTQHLPALLVFIFVLYRLQPRVKQLDSARAGLVSLTASVQEVTALLDRGDKPYIVSGPTPYRGLRHAIRFDAVDFEYHAQEGAALRGVTLTIPAGSTTALVGPSGAGKTTLIKLLLRFYDPTRGEVRIDDTPLRELDLRSWRERIALVSQDIHVFNTTVRENIAYGKLDASESEVVEAAKLADAHRFITQLPEGYETVVGDRGMRLSGGQQQRLTLARAIVRNPDLIILDEATNALDSISEHAIQEALEVLRKDRTVVVIAHRLSTIERADHIVVMDEGRVREEGDVHALLANGDLFARLYRLQNRGASPEPVR